MRFVAAVLCSLALPLLSACRQPCDPSQINREGAELVDEIDAWSPRDGRLPDFWTAAASIVWKGCDARMPPGFRGYLDFSVPHPPAPWESEGRLAPKAADWNPIEDHLPEHRGVHGGPFNGKDPRVMTWVEGACPGVTDVARRARDASAEVRGVVIREGCGLNAVPWLDRDPPVGLELVPLDLVGVALRDYLVDLGVQGPVADRLLFEIIAGSHKPLERPFVGAPIDTRGLALPAAAQGEVLEQIPKNVVYVDERSVRVRNNVVAKRNDTAKLADLIPEEERALAWSLVGNEHSDDVLLVADQNTAWSLVVEIAEASRTASEPGVGTRTVWCAVLRDDRVDRLQAIPLPLPTELDSRATLQEVLLETMQDRTERPESDEAGRGHELDPDTRARNTGLYALKSLPGTATALEDGHRPGPSVASGPPGERGLRVRMAKTTVDGTLDKDLLRGAFQAHLSEIRECYEKGLAKKPKLKGRVTIEFVIGGAGRVTSSSVAASRIDDDTVGTCVARAVKRWNFPKPRDGADVTVELPVLLWPE